MLHAVRTLQTAAAKKVKPNQEILFFALCCDIVIGRITQLDVLLKSVRIWWLMQLHAIRVYFGSVPPSLQVAHLLLDLRE